ncbi:hypothetical protein DES36_11094 [Alkalibaculum bacchi]|uniref:DUF2953 family protein n=1 Tax=Alkalibaculum bacchi TaxID=645887 RepID=A0A366I534_9FIRM|nr:hypothetical protein [Alkalibaculum bacchi]RBP63351.1 hypothetical protein DES36_11094 [Alkalibaculum bacchi]
MEVIFIKILLILIASSLVIITILLFKIALHIRLKYHSNESNINVSLVWLEPFFKAFITIEDLDIYLKLYLFNKLILNRKLKNRKTKSQGLDFVKKTDPQNVHVNVQYGFRDPFMTGISCGLMNFTSEFIDVESMNQVPDFMAGDDYIHLDATANINIGSTLLKMLR